MLGYKIASIPRIDIVTVSTYVAGSVPVNFNSAGKGKDKQLYGTIYFLSVHQIQVSKVKKTPRNPAFIEYYSWKVYKSKTKV